MKLSEFVAAHLRFKLADPSKETPAVRVWLENVRAQVMRELDEMEARGEAPTVEEITHALQTRGTFQWKRKFAAPAANGNLERYGV